MPGEDLTPRDASFGRNLIDQERPDRCEGITWPSHDELSELFLEKYGLPTEVGFSAARRVKANYYPPADVYEAMVAKHVFPGCAWIDVGGGHDIFPDNPKLARTLASRCACVVAVDPDRAVHENRFVTERHQCRIEDYRDQRRFHLATLRMVVEHVDEPVRLVRALRAVLLPDASVVVLTVNGWSPISIVSRLMPFALHHPIKRLFWGGDERDTFPVRYLMNTRATLRRQFESEGFVESAFGYLDDLSTFGQFRTLGTVELAAWSVLRRIGIVYPENCLLGIYRAPSASVTEES
jgi:hypothetical protein